MILKAMVIIGFLTMTGFFYMLLLEAEKKAKQVNKLYVNRFGGNKDEVK